jgi:uncharacterized membrane protein YfcA
LRRELAGQRARLARLTPAALLGGLAGGYLLLHTNEALFRRLVPWLILGASALLAVQDPLRAFLLRRLAAANGAGDGAGHGRHGEAIATPLVFGAAVYGGYFGAGLGVIVLAVLGLVLHDSLTRLNASKQAIGFAANLAGALLFAAFGPVHWPAAAAMAVGAVAGGVVGGRFASRIRASTLRTLVVATGTIVGLIYLIRG